MIPKSIDRYEITGELGRGGMATVYRARDPRFKRDVAVKVLPQEFLHQPTFRERFHREAETIAALEHPAIVPVYDFGELDGQPYFVMRYMPGGSLWDRLKDGGLSIAESARILTRLAPALDQAHRMGIIHRDLKPQNILFGNYDNAFISDFGSARIAQASTALTGDAIVGTPAYMSPEQARGDEDLDGRSDIYALGAILFEMLTGQQPYNADTPMGVAVKHITEPVPRILEVRSDLPPGCETIISRAMAKDREDRYASAPQMADAFMDVAREGTSQPEQLNPAPIPQEVKAIPVEPPRKEWFGFPRWFWVLGVLIAIAGFCGVFTISGGTLAILSGLSNPTPASSPIAISVTPETFSGGDDILFQDDFSDLESGWVRLEDDLAFRDYDGGGYRIQVNEVQAYNWATANLFLTDVIIEVATRKISGPEDNDFGVICRYQDVDNFYFFVISSDGFFSINKYSDGEYQIIDRDSYEFNEVILTGEVTNQLRVECNGSRLQLSVNGQTLAEVEDSDFGTGDVGLIAGTFDEPGTDILFDDFIVRRP
jgi:serine/threonine-protein kinase